MYLKEIVATGFKSFADKFDIKLDDKTTCIVGPNGSGKSNVVDAVRWVLGEQSVKSLRGTDSMSDVIFSGSKSRSPLNVASVELIFDNSDHFLNVSYTEISIKRRVYRSGENEYFLNGERCRLKDINNLLIDSGMGKESFNIISQGEVEKILSSSSTDRRVIFEEAAGILKYKKRKEEALRKLDRTHSNLDRINDIIGELELQVGPLKEQKEKAEEYLENKKGLDKYEVALLSYDIYNLNEELENLKIKKEKTTKEIVNLSTDTSLMDASNLEDNNKLERLENEKNNLNKELLKVTEEVEKINGEKNLLVERSKSNKEENEIKEELRNLLNNKNNLDGKLKVLDEEIKEIVNLSKIEEDKEEVIESKSISLKKKQNMLKEDYSKHDQDIISTNNRINSLKREIESLGDVPNSVRSVLKDNSLDGIYDIIGNVISCDSEYSKALNVAVASNKNFIITKDEECSKQAINYLKDNHLGRATFFPLSVIKSRYVTNDIINILNSDRDFIGILSDLIKYDNLYKNIIENQFGNIVICKDMDSALRISKHINNRYKIITLLGDVINVGGSMTGGSINSTKSIIMTKEELKHSSNKLKYLEEEIVSIKKDIDSNLEEISKLEESKYELISNKVTLKNRYNEKLRQKEDINNEINTINSSLSRLESISNNTFDKREEELIKLFYEKSSLKEQIQIKISSISREIEDLKIKIDEALAIDKVKNSTLRNLEREDRELDININRLDVKIDNMLNTLSLDYELSYEKARELYKLDIEADEARVLVNKYRSNIKRIGMVNIDAIDEFERVNTRYVFLTNQREDLFNAEDTLLEIMNEMDGVMKEEFDNTFSLIRTEFQKVFRELFNGGQADLKLTNPDDILTTGVDIVASPPGKKLTTISLLSGGEKTLTAISLLFAILNVRSVPFCLFDEVEAALDEANVDAFGKYLDNYRNKTQFLIITHKKKTMEYANTLYGITMQESGVSKLVSVKLTNYVETI